MGRFLPPDHSKGDPNTIGGYMAVHDRPAAFEGSDGASYSVEIVTDTSGEKDRPFAAVKTKLDALIKAKRAEMLPWWDAMRQEGSN